MDVGWLMGAEEDRDRVIGEDGEKVRISLGVHIRGKPAPGPLRRLFYRAEPARDWEPRLDDLWDRAKRWYPIAAVRDADYALRRFAGHPTVRHHRFLVFPRFSDKAVAFAVFVDKGSECCWLDLMWDHDHPGAFELLIHISSRLAVQWGSGGERLCLAGDDAASELLTHRGFRVQEELGCWFGTSAFTGQLDAENTVGRAYLTTADVRELDR